MFWELNKTFEFFEKPTKTVSELYRVDRYGTPNIAKNLQHKMAFFASLNPHISGGGQPPRTKFSTSVEAPGLHFRPKAWWNGSNRFCAI